MVLDQVDIKGGESYPDILERIKQILNKEWVWWNTSEVVGIGLKTSCIHIDIWFM